MGKAKFHEGDKVRIKKGRRKDSKGEILYILRQYPYTDHLVYGVKFSDGFAWQYYSYQMDPIDVQSESDMVFNTPICYSLTKVDENGNATVGDGHYVSEVSVNFGIGRVAIGMDVRQWTEKTSTPYIFMQATKDPHKIGISVEQLEVDDAYPSVVLNFVNEAGLDMLIEMAMNAKKYFQNHA